MTSRIGISWLGCKLCKFGCDRVDEECSFSDEAEVASCFFDEVADRGEVSVRVEKF